MRPGKLVVFVAMLALGACGGEPTPSAPASEGNSPEASASQAESASPPPAPTPSPSKAPPPSPSESDVRTLAFASPCKVAETTLGGEIFELLGGEQTGTTFYEPGEQVAGEPTKDYGCLFDSSDADAQFSFWIGGTVLTEKAFKQQIPTAPDCSRVVIPADLGASAAVATSCPTGKYTTLAIEALYGDRGLTCGTRVLSERVNNASTDYSVDLCIEIAEQVTRAG